jgi:hypothetical protein
MTCFLSRSRRALIFAILCAVPAALAPAAETANDLAANRSQLYSDYSGQLGELAAWCDSNTLPQQAEFTRKWLPKRDPAMIYVFTLPENSAPPPKLVESEAGQQWWSKFADLRRQQADKLFELAQSAVKAKQPALAFELARETVRENPDHAPGRKILGYEKYQDSWKTAEAARRLRDGQLWSDSFGWLPADQLSRYQHGMRFYRGNWIDTTDDARLHSNIKNGWHVETDHYAVTTNHSLEEGVRLAGRLETLYEVWRQAFLPYYATAADVERWFADAAASTGETPANSSTASPPHKLHQVVYFRDKQQYVDALIHAHPQIEISLGIYIDTANTAYFFHDAERHDATLNHEGTHQLFYESKPGAIRAGKKNNFWIVEGIACYMESLAEHRLLPGETYGSYITLGGDNEGRVPAARKRLLDDNFYVPLRELVAYGMDTLQHDERLPKLYSQSTGLAYFLMHADGGRYRPALMDYLIAVYTGHAAPDTLEKLTGQRFEELDRQYREFMK